MRESSASSCTCACIMRWVMQRAAHLGRRPAAAAAFRWNRPHPTTVHAMRGTDKHEQDSENSLAISHESAPVRQAHIPLEPRGVSYSLSGYLLLRSALKVRYVISRYAYALRLGTRMLSL
jgi:hypothetical protein